MRDRILNTAEDLFREHGCLRVTVIDVAHALDMSPANVYRFFESKNDLRSAVTENLSLRMENMCLCAARQESGSGKQLSGLILEYFAIAADRFVADPNIHELFALAARENWTAIDNHISRMKKIICDIICDGISSEEFKVRDTESAADVVYTAMFTFFGPACASKPRLNEADAQRVYAICQFIINALRTNCI